MTVAKQTQKKYMNINLGERRLKDLVLNNRINIETEVLLQQYTAPGSVETNQEGTDWLATPNYP